jgi:hypothetical protein
LPISRFALLAISLALSAPVARAATLARRSSERVTKALRAAVQLPRDEFAALALRVLRARLLRPLQLEVLAQMDRAESSGDGAAIFRRVMGGAPREFNRTFDGCNAWTSRLGYDGLVALLGRLREATAASPGGSPLDLDALRASIDKELAAERRSSPSATVGDASRLSVDEKIAWIQRLRSARPGVEDFSAQTHYPQLQRSGFHLDGDENSTLFRLEPRNEADFRLPLWIHVFRNARGKSPREKFTLNELVKLGYYTRAEARHYRASEEGLQPEQTQYVYALEGDAREGRAKALVRVVSGQVLDPNSATPTLRPLASIPPEIADRTRFPLQWEIGRGRSLHPYLSRLTFAATAWTLQRQIKAYGGDVRQAHVFLRTRGMPRRRLYERLGFETLNPDRPGVMGSYYLTIPLTTLLREYPPELFLPAARLVRDAIPSITAGALSRLIDRQAARGGEILDLKLKTGGESYGVEWRLRPEIYRQRTVQDVNRVAARYGRRGLDLARGLESQRQLSHRDELTVAGAEELGGEGVLTYLGDLLRRFEHPRESIARLLVEIHDRYGSDFVLPTEGGERSLRAVLRDLKLPEALDNQTHVSRPFFKVGGEQVARLRAIAESVPAEFDLAPGHWGRVELLERPFNF